MPFPEPLHQLGCCLLVLVHEFVPSLTELYKLLLLLLLKSFQLSFVDEVEEVPTPLILTLPHQLYFLFGLLSLLVDGIFLTLFSVVVEESQKVNDSRIGPLAVLILLIYGSGLYVEFTKPKNEQKLVECDRINTLWE